MIDAITSNTEIISEVSQDEERDLFQEATSRLIDGITQAVPISYHDLTQAVKEVKEKVSINGKISLSLLLAELKSECDRLDHINSEMTSKAQSNSEKKIKNLTNKQASANSSKGNIALYQLIALVVVGIGTLTVSPKKFDSITQLTSTLTQHLGSWATSYYESENIRCASTLNLEQSKYSDRNQKAQASQGGKQDRAQMLQQILQAQLGAARLG